MLMSADFKMDAPDWTISMKSLKLILLVNELRWKVVFGLVGKPFNCYFQRYMTYSRILFLKISTLWSHRRMTFGHVTKICEIPFF